jgi:hypothetical protein
VLYSEALNDIYALDPSTLTWTNLTFPDTTPDDQHVWPSPRGYPGFAAAGGKVYLFGGADDGEGASESAVADAGPAAFEPIMMCAACCVFDTPTHFITDTLGWRLAPPEPTVVYHRRERPLISGCINL